MLSVAKRKKLSHLSFEDFLDFTNINLCYYCGEDVIWYKFQDVKRKGGKGYHLDRKDCSRGYEKDNLVVCCRRCNRGKGAEFSHDEWLCIGNLIRQMREESKVLKATA